MKPPRFAVGNLVRVKRGTPDPDFPVLTLGGWAGPVVEVDHTERPPLYLIAWDQRTLAAMHPAYRERCEREGLEANQMWLKESELETDDGSAFEIEPWSDAALRLLQEANPEDRIRAILGWPEEDSLPPVSREYLSRYLNYLGLHLEFPFPAWCWEERGEFAQRKFTGQVDRLLERLSPEDGILCVIQRGDERKPFPLADIAVPDAGPNQRLIEDYASWIGTSEEEWEPTWVEHRLPIPAGTIPVVLRSLLGSLIVAGVGGAVYGAVLGIGYQSLEGADIAAKVGGAVLAVAVGWLGASSGQEVGLADRMRYGGWLGGIVGAVAGLLLGALLGVLLMAIWGSLLGAMAGGLIGRLVFSSRNRTVGTLVGVAAGAVVGMVVLSFHREAERAWVGASTGVIAGAVTGPVLLAILFGLVSLSQPGPDQRSEE